MSQAKVDRYKEQKANRQKIMKKEKRERMLWKVGSYAVLLVLVAWIGVSAYNRFHVETRKFYEADTTAVDTYLNGLTVEEADEADTAEDAAAEDEDAAAEETDTADGAEDAVEEETAE